MGPYLFANAILVGFFAFGAIYHLILWSRSRDRVVLAFAALALVSAVNSYAIVSLVTAGSPAEAQRALDLRSWSAAMSVVALTWFFAMAAAARTRWFVWPVTIVLAVMTLRGMLGTPLTGRVLGLRHVVAPWGETLAAADRSPASPLLFVAYALALMVPFFGFWTARRLAASDRVGGVLVAVAALGLLASSVVALWADALGSTVPYTGPIVAALWILPIAWQVARQRVIADAARDRLERQLLQAQKLEALGQLAGGVAHDFNNLLTVISAHTELLLADTTDASAQAELVQIQLAAERAAAMTRQLLAFGRQSRLEPRVVNVNAVVDRAEAMLRRTIGDHIELVVEAAPVAPHVRADPDQIVRVLVNLAINARDAMPGGGQLRITTDTVTVPEAPNRPAAAPRPGPYARLTVSDTGVGMSDAVKARLFEPFFTTKQQGQGTGLGLAVVDGIIRQSDGWVDVDSAPGAGTTFRIHLPAITSRPEAEPAAEAARPTAGGQEVILLVEDQTAVREVTVAALERQGYNVMSAAGGAEALALVGARQAPIDLVLTDVVMPGMSGPQLVERLREQLPAIRAVFMSGYAADAVARPDGGRRTGFIQKPFTAAMLGAKLRQVLAQD
ncbi:MAG: ATP-binding protein [Vicinamibacterales bacterium]